MKTIKTPEEILSERSIISIRELEFKNEVQLIRPSEAIRAIKEYAAQLELTDEDIEGSSKLKDFLYNESHIQPFSKKWYDQLKWCIKGAKFYRSQLKEMQK